ncbi:unnamed protein product [Larinioides sclopetarius]|uniref:Secreted protein n=1 Tax=Larinioides sclopetarius TaxID=280406 RepID=A0AAV2BGF7_9ARAC
MARHIRASSLVLIVASSIFPQFRRFVIPSAQLGTLVCLPMETPSTGIRLVAHKCAFLKI